jgi:hypothetical protein
MTSTPIVADQSTTPLKGLTVNVYRPADGLDCTLGGFSSRFDKLTVVGVIRKRPSDRGGRMELVCEPMPRHSRVRAADPVSAPAALLYHREIFGKSVWAIVPAPEEGTSIDLAAHVSRVMMGSNFAYTTDDRLREITGLSGPVAIHDRVERRG